ncbi:MAG: hypothetical protein DMF59_02860 [Acidobacteria bacterium]|nr:MAG: hypothetical protein DMF59_02860 [Acidobacteriota bacterium]
MTERDELHMLKNMKAPMAALLLFATSLSARGVRNSDFRTATPAELAMQSVPFAPGVPAVVLNWIQRRDDVAMYESEYLRIKVLAPEGKKYGDVEIPYISQWTGAVAFEARLTRPDGTIIPFNGKTYDKLAVRFGSIRVMVKTFSIPDVQPGSIIEYCSEVGLRYTPMHYTFTLQRDLPVLSAMLWIHPVNDPWLIDYRRLPQDVKKTKTRDTFQLDIQNIPPFEAEPYSLPDRELKAVAHFFYTDRDLKLDTFWLDKGRAWTPIIEDFISGDVAPIHEAAQQAIALATTPEEKLRKLYAVAQRIRNLDYESDKTEAEEKRLRENRSAQDVLRNGYGHSIEITRLFIALARSAGFEAHAVCIGSRRDGFFTKTLPSASQLDDEVALVRLDGKEIAIDAGTPMAPFATLAWQKAPVPGLKLQKKRDPEWIETPGLDATCARVVHKVALRVAGDAITSPGALR